MDQVIKEYNDDALGHVCYVKKSGVKHLRITLRHFKGVRITVPARVSLAEAEKFVSTKQAWIKKNMKKIREQEGSLTAFEENKRYKTKFHRIRIIKKNVDRFRMSIDEREATIFIPAGMAVEDEQVQEHIRRLVEEVWRLEAKNYLPQRVAHLAELHGFSYGKVFVRNTKTRWGSCTATNNINLSIHLMRLPGHLIDYVILHELCHTKHKNHGKTFWHALEKLTGNAKGLAKELKIHRLNIY